MPNDKPILMRSVAFQVNALEVLRGLYATFGRGKWTIQSWAYENLGSEIILRLEVMAEGANPSPQAFRFLDYCEILKTPVDQRSSQFAEMIAVVGEMARDAQSRRHPAV